MRKSVAFIMITGMLAAFWCVAVCAAVNIDKSNAAKGIVSVALSDVAGKTIAAQVEKGGNKYSYRLIKSQVNLPLQMGAGDYKITILEGVGNDKFKPLVAESLSVAAIDETELFKASVPQVDYASSKTAIPAYKTLTKGESANSEKLKIIYDKIVKNISYDYAKTSTVKDGYLPDIDAAYNAKKGICYDYAALLGGALRSQGIPAKIVTGYVPDVNGYHAWNEVLVGGKWIAVDATYDSQIVKAGQEYIMEKDRSAIKVLKIY